MCPATTTSCSAFCLIQTPSLGSTERASTRAWCLAGNAAAETEVTRTPDLLHVSLVALWLCWRCLDTLSNPMMDWVSQYVVTPLATMYNNSARLDPRRTQVYDCKGKWRKSQWHGSLPITNAFGFGQPP